jgi:hypothetical protein
MIVPIDTTPAQQMVTLPVETVRQYQEQRAQFENMAAQQANEAAAATARAMIARGEVESVVQRTAAEVKTAQQAASRYAASAELSRSLASHQLAPGAAEQLTQLWRDEVRADLGADGSFTVASKDFRPVADFVAAKLADPSYSHFKASSGHAAPANASNPAAPAQPAEQLQPRNLGEAYLMRALAEKQAREAAQTANPTTNPSQGFGGFGKQHSGGFFSIAHALRGSR